MCNIIKYAYLSIIAGFSRGNCRKFSWILSLAWLYSSRYSSMAVFMASALISARLSQQKKDFTEENEDIVGYVSGMDIYIYIYTHYMYILHIYIYTHYIHTIYILYIYIYIYIYIYVCCINKYIYIYHIYIYTCIVFRTLEHQQNNINMTFWCVWEICFSWGFNEPTVYTPTVHVFFWENMPSRRICGSLYALFLQPHMKHLGQSHFYISQYLIGRITHVFLTL